MAETTGPILAVGAITLGNATILHGRAVDFRIPVGTAIAAAAFALAERVAPAAAKGLAWIALVSVIFTRLQPDVPAPAESLLSWWNGGGPDPAPGAPGGAPGGGAARNADRNADRFGQPQLSK